MKLLKEVYFNTKSHAQVFESYKLFSRNIVKINENVHNDHQLNMQMIADIVNMLKEHFCTDFIKQRAVEPDFLGKNITCDGGVDLPKEDGGGGGMRIDTIENSCQQE